MERYIIVYKDGKYEDWCTEIKLKNTQPSLIFFICRKETVHSYGYGEHADYTFCDRDGNAAPLKVSDLSFLSFRTYGTQRNFILSWKIERSGATEEYALSRDNIWQYTPSVDDEWENPIKDTIRLIHDIRRFGLDVRKDIDSLKRVIYSKDWSINWKLKRYWHLRDIDYEKSGLHLSTYAVKLPYLEKDYKKLALVKSRFNVQEALAFLRDELEKRERTFNLLEDGNVILSKYASSLEKVFVKDGVTTIEDEQFDDCKNARVIILPPSVTCIVQTAFNFTPAENVYITSPARVSLNPASPAPGIMLTKAKFYVPSELVESYRTNLFWKSLSNRILPINEEDGQR